MMKANHPIVTLVTLTVCALSGCKSISNLAHHCGAAIDPDCRKCIDEVGTCALCGDAPADLQGVDPAAYSCPACEAKLIHSGDPNLLSQVEEIRGDTDTIRSEVNDLTAELRQRNQSLIQTRSELSRLQSELAQVRTNVGEWQQSVKNLNDQIQVRDRERLSALHQMSASIERIVADNHQTSKSTR